MPEGKPSFAPHLSVVRPDQPPRQSAPSDWTGKMALAQAGNRQRYRELLLEIEPYIRSIARRCFKHDADVKTRCRMFC
jgi:hypothetical protein